MSAAIGLLEQIRDELRNLRDDMKRQAYTRPPPSTTKRSGKFASNCHGCDGTGMLGPAEIDNCGMCNPRKKEQQP